MRHLILNYPETLRVHAKALTPVERPGDYAQAVMDLGATICTPKSPACGICPWRDPCLARRNGTAAELPKKTPKKPTKTSPTSDEAIDLDPTLPIIKIVSEEEEMHIKLELEMDDNTHKMLVKWGKEAATDEDYVEIAVRAGLKEYIDSLDKEDTLPLV